MQKKWVEGPAENPQHIEDIQKCLGINPILATLLVKRGIITFQQAYQFFRPKLEHLHNPFLMKDMELAIARIEKAIEGQEKVLIYGDYDVDGTTAIALVYSFFKNYFSAIDFYVPDRHKEGYGISIPSIKYAAQHGFQLVIALDCGIKSLHEIQYASTLGIDFMVCDHHKVGTELPNGVAVLDPKRLDCSYPYKDLSGCGIGFKLVQAFAQKHAIPFEAIQGYLDLVMVSIASDIVPITGENRVMAWHGLKKFNVNPRKGLEALMRVAGKMGNYDITDVAFIIGPRINAAGRIDHARDAVNLLLADTPQQAEANSVLIDLKNLERKEHDTSITKEALQMIETDHAFMHKKTTVVYHEKWHKGVIGIVASRLIEKYYRPTVVLTNTDKLVAGSARSITGFDLYEALSSCGDLLEQFGGHKYAAGLTLKLENVPAFQQRFEEVVSRCITHDMLQQEIPIDATIALSDIDTKFFRILKQFGPFGPGNPTPVFLSKNVCTYRGIQIIGDNHLKMCVMQENSPIFECIGFGLAPYAQAISKAKFFDMCYVMEMHTWNSKTSFRLNVKDIRVNHTA